ncbi:glycosyltransferase [Lacticaseibacillus paracasei]|uniref:glycosyltransferase n=1 Tax=Lacticaseibacillus paracasei TaxID=1597 RepID=UPI0003A30EDC|nr:glycosyltransferase [Lacticaseibacillus paracasei]
MKKVFIVTPYLSGRGGTETVIQKFFSILGNDSTFKFELFVLGGTDDTSWLQNVSYNLKKLILPLALKKFEYIFRLPFWILSVIRKKPDIVVSTSPIIWTIFFLFKKITRSKYQVVGWYHFSLSKNPISFFELKRMDYFWAISSDIAEEVREKGFPSDRITTVFNPIQVEENFTMIKQPSTKSPFHFVYMGRFDFDGQKNLSELFRGLSQINQKFTLDIYGEGADKGKLLQLAGQLKIDNHTEWKGFRKQVWREIRNCDALILTSKYEGLPMVLIESLAAGLPVISSNCPTGPNDIVQDGKNGYLYEPGNIEELTTDLTAVRKLEDWNKPQVLAESVEKFNYLNYKKRILGALASISNL